MAWRDISSAPKDGTEIILFGPQYQGEPPHRLMWFAAWDNSLDMWALEGETIASPDWPTHWQPLPNPPKVEND